MELCIKLFLTLLMMCETLTTANEKIKQGHLKKLGSHRDPFGVTMIGKFSAPSVFYGHFVHPGKPLWMKSVLELADHPGLTNWTDSFLKKEYGSETVKVESSKKENRGAHPRWITFRQFLSLYKTEDIYMVHTLKNKMEDLVLVPSCLHCGGFQKAIQEAVMWMGSGATMSVLHQDELDNLLCILDGQKDFVLIDKVYKQEVEADGFIENEGYSKVNVAKVDLVKFPRLASVPWHEVHLQKGDCLFIPKGWYHQVNSDRRRHLAINIWFSHLFWFDTANCSLDQDFHRLLEPVSTFGFATPNEVYRSKLLEQLHGKGIMVKPVFVSTLDKSTEERRIQFFEAIDRYKDSALSWSELYGFDIDMAVAKFPDIFGLPGYSLSSAQEKVILYDPIPTFDDDSEDDNNHIIEEGKQDDGVVHGDSEDADPSLSFASSPLPVDSIEVGASQIEHEWTHDDLYRHSDISDPEDIHDHSQGHVYSYTESDGDDEKMHDSDKKEEL